LLDEAFDLVSDHGGLAAGDALEQIVIWHESDALPPWPIARGEMRLNVVIRTEHGADLVNQLLPDLFRLGETELRECVLLEQYLAADDLVDPGFVHLKPAQFLRDLDGVAP